MGGLAVGVLSLTGDGLLGRDLDFFIFALEVLFISSGSVACARGLVVGDFCLTGDGFLGRVFALTGDALLGRASTPTKCPGLCSRFVGAKPDLTLVVGVLDLTGDRFLVSCFGLATRSTYFSVLRSNLEIDRDLVLPSFFATGDLFFPSRVLGDRVLGRSGDRFPLSCFCFALRSKLSRRRSGESSYSVWSIFGDLFFLHV